jgi:lysine 2,3-aminomutase
MVKDLAARLTDRSNPKWTDWKWQQRHSVKDLFALAGYFQNIDPGFFYNLKEYSQGLKFKITPYILSQLDPLLTKEELVESPWFHQFFPLGEVYRKGTDAFDGTDNWEAPEEFPTSLLHHKYTNRVVVRFSECMSYCNFCFEALRVLEEKPEGTNLIDMPWSRQKKKNWSWNEWKVSLEYLKNHPEVEEAVLSGGEPLLQSDERLDRILKDLSEIETVRFKRIHTRTLTLNPYRFTDGLLDVLDRYSINDVTFGILHPSELTDDFRMVVQRIRRTVAPILGAHIPLLKNVNADTETLRELFLGLYELNIKPYYLLHSMPHTPYADKQRLSVKDGIRLVKPLKRHISNVAFPEYILAHYDGKVTVPFELDGTPEFQYCRDDKGNPVVRFLNWKGDWVEYPDAEDMVVSP